MLATQKSHLVWILAKREESKASQEWIVPKNLIEAQGYYEGNAKVWLPKSLLQSQTSHLPFPEQRPQESKPKQLWRPITTSSNNVTPVQKYQATSMKQEQKWVPKDSVWVPKESVCCYHPNTIKAKIQNNSTMGPEEMLN